MPILRRLIQSQEKIYLVDKLFDFVNPENTDISQNALSDNGNTSTTEIINLLIKDKGKEIKYFTFKVGEDDCVFIISDPLSKSANIKEIETYPSIHSRLYYNYHTRCTNMDNGEITFHDFDGTKVENPILTIHNRMLLGIRILNSSDEVLPDVIIYSFQKLQFAEQLNFEKECEYYSLKIEAELDKKIQKVLFYTEDSKEYAIKELRIIPVRDYHWISANKKTETTYELSSFHSRTIGSNNWDIDTTTEGVFNFSTDKWDSFEQNEEHHKL
ncbi:MAG: hypothetical protein JSR11_03855 [Bacteroidetes bacterium]|nr:hypothetical protein [Bacteroidota bacterium]